ncbi:MAG TPA: ATP synthase F0 subunit B [Polyangiaceae bacterium]
MNVPRLLTSWKARRIAFAVMLLVTAWSVWAFAQHPHHHRPLPGQSPDLASHPRPAPPTLLAPGAARAAHEAREAEDKAADGETEHLPPINWTEFGGTTPPYLAMLINFGILVAGYYLLGRKPIAAALQNRRDTISKDIEEAHKMLAEAQARAKSYQAKLEHLELEVKTARAALVQAGEAERDRIVGDAEAKAERMRKDAEFLVDQELKQIRQDLWRDTVEAAVGAAEELLKKRVTAADQERMAEDYLADLGGKKTGHHSMAPTEETAS